MDYETLRQKVRELPPLEPYALANPFWDERRLGLRHSLLHDDINRFLHWPDVGFTMFLGNWPWVKEEWEAISKMRPSWIGALSENSLGGPEIYPGSGSSANVIHQAFHLLTWEEHTQKRVTDLKSIVEIGAGYGAMCRLIHRLGFQGEYYIYDLPEVALLQDFYLSQTLVKEPKIIRLENKLPRTPELVMGMWSFSEMPSDLRNSLTQDAVPQYWFFGYQYSFDGVDNRVYFRTFQAEHPSYQWADERILHHPGESWYIFGDKEEEKAIKKGKV